LAIETCTPEGSLAVSKGENVLTSRQWGSQGSHSNVITQQLEDCLKESGLQLKDLGAIIVGVGPGSFTGIRIGLNLAKSLAYAFDLPVYEFSSLINCAEPAAKNGKTIVFSAMNAFRNLYYCSKYQQRSDGFLEIISPESALTIEEITVLLDHTDCVVGDAASSLHSELASKKIEIFSAGLTPIAANYVPLFFRQTKVESSIGATAKVWNQVAPLYVRASEAEEKLKKT
jgi:tRNA threonylcarbamoyladenosine biosynthesis protein TsaB